MISAVLLCNKFPLVLHLLFGSIGLVAALPSGFREEGVSRVVGMTTIAFIPKIDEPGFLIFAAVKDGAVVAVPDIDNPNSGENNFEVLNIASRVCANGERGVHQVLAHPDFLNNRRIYISYTYDKNGDCLNDATNGAVNRLSRFRVRDDYRIVESSEVVLLETNPLAEKFHNAGDMFFGNDGYLYLTIGDGGQSAGAQDTGTLQGTVVRLTEDGGIPPDNPFQGSDSRRCSENAHPGSNCREVYAYGLRNPYRFALDPNTNDGSTRFYVADVGGKVWEEISEGGTDFPGANYGWGRREGPCRRDSFTNCDPDPEFTDPFFWYAHGDDGEEGAAVTGVAAVPNGMWANEYDDSILYLEFVQGEMYVIKNDGTSCSTPTCDRPVPSWQNTLFHKLDDSNVGRGVQLLFGPYENNRQGALYYTVAVGRQNIRRVIYEGTRNSAPIARITADRLQAPLGTSIQFDASESSDRDGDDLEYLWDFGDGSTSTEVSPLHEFSSTGNFDVELTVTDTGGFSGTATLQAAVGVPPTPMIQSPPEGTNFSVGDIFMLIGSATDGNGNQLPDASLTWEVRQHHNTHFHPFLDPTIGNNISIDPAPSPEDYLAATTSHLEVLMTATDETGFSATTNVIIMPQIVELLFNSEPSGLELLVDGYTITTPVSVSSWTNHPLEIVANDQNGLYFDTWSEGAGARRVVIVGSESGYQVVAYFTSCRPIGLECENHGDCCSGSCGSGNCDATGAPSALPSMTPSESPSEPPSMTPSESPSDTPTITARLISRPSFQTAEPAQGTNFPTPLNTDPESSAFSFNIRSFGGLMGILLSIAASII